MLSAYSRVQPSPRTGSIILILTVSRSSACIAAITSFMGRVVNWAFIFLSPLALNEIKRGGIGDRVRPAQLFPAAQQRLHSIYRDDLNSRSHHGSGQGHSELGDFLARARNTL